ncbi:MAG: response regulator [Nitriliruptorales bacterium]
MGLRCMIVDDNRDYLQAACKVLAQGGITVVGVASSSAEALRHVEEADPDVVLVDIVLGSESGFDLARRLATAGSIRASVIMISTHGEEDFADLIEASPAIGFLPKWNLSASAINDLLSRREAEKNRGQGPRSPTGGGGAQTL